jgi:hypothetical protein
MSQCGLRAPAQIGDHVLKTVIRVPQKLSWRQWRLARRFAALEPPDVGTVDGLETDVDHKFNVNVVEPDKKINPILQHKRVEQNPLSWTDQIRQRFGMTTQKDSKII